MSSATPFKRNYGIPTSLLVGVLLFLLPFVQVSCNNEPFAENSGVGLVLGTNYKVTGQIKAFSDSFGKHNDRNKNFTSNSGTAYNAALVALLFGLVALIVSVVYARSGTSTMILSSLAAISLIVLAFQIKADVNKSVKLHNDNDSVGAIVNVRFTIWYYLSVVSFLLAAFFSYLQKPWDRFRDMPPVTAPQLSVKNPGEQSDFPTSPEQSDLER